MCVCVLSTTHGSLNALMSEIIEYRSQTQILLKDILEKLFLQTCECNFHTRYTCMYEVMLLLHKSRTKGSSLEDQSIHNNLITYKL